MQRQTLIAVLLGLLAVAGVALWLTLSSAAEPEPVLLAAPEPAAKVVPPKPIAPPPPRQQVYHLPPPGQDEPEERPSGPSADLHPDDARAFQRAGVTAGGRAKDLCLKPWAEETGSAAEVVMDTVVHDGVVADVQLRTLTELPYDVLECVRDAAWAVEWPEADAPGEVRFQNSIKVGM